MLTIQCPDCEYQDQGYDTDLIMTAYRKHHDECTGQRAGIFMPERRTT